MAWTCCDSGEEMKLGEIKVPFGDGSAKAWEETGCTEWEVRSQQ